MRPEMLQTPVVEDLNRLGCPEDQERHAGEPARSREALERLRWIDTSDLDHYHRQGWISRHERELLERFFGFARDRLCALPPGEDPLDFSRADPGWQVVRERARELLQALDAFADIGVDGWGHQYRPRDPGRTDDRRS